ncbi:hypothetical protein K1720_00300 [Thermococcus argininiproducens]|uniref:Uncharacterized protein n=1 Tax=Thermococcus argininiproducens TaxID=2866384 RepID=A0A9E7MA52_9EURY|nr:hypothetical protein [Thermococcus argininiproducens]USG99968.1 hypothetical protein K1720_00300 [Thermococcus argininiproducens]
METDLLTPKERYNGVVLIGVRKNEIVEFIKVYAENKDLAKELLEQFLYEKGIHPADFVVVDQGYESVEGKEIISTRTESELSAFLARFGLRLLSNGVLYLQGKREIYQITSVSQDLLEEIKARTEKTVGMELKEEPLRVDLDEINLPESIKEKLKPLELMEDALIINYAELPISKILKSVTKGAVKIPESIKIGNFTVKIFDEDLHEVIAKNKGEILIKPPVIVWDGYIDSMEDFEFQPLNDSIYNAPLFLKACKGFLILQEPPLELLEKLSRIKEKGFLKLKGKVAKIKERFTIIVDTKNPTKYDGIMLPIKIKLPSLENKEMKEILEKEIGLEIPLEILEEIPTKYRTFKGIITLVKLFNRLQSKRPEKEPIELLKEALSLFLGEDK